MNYDGGGSGSNHAWPGFANGQIFLMVWCFQATIVIGIGNNPTLKTDLDDEYEKDDDVGSNPRVVSGYLSVHRRQLPGPPTLLPMSPLQIIPVLLFGEFAHQDSVEAFRVRISTSWKVSADEKRKYMVCMQHII